MLDIHEHEYGYPEFESQALVIWCWSNFNQFQFLIQVFFFLQIGIWVETYWPQVHTKLISLATNRSIEIRLQCSLCSVFACTYALNPYKFVSCPCITGVWTVNFVCNTNNATDLFYHVPFVIIQRIN